MKEIDRLRDGPGVETLRRTRDAVRRHLRDAHAREIEELILELEGHQIELELQNRDLKQARQELEQVWHNQKMETVSRLAAGVAHSLNNLLTSVLGYGRLACDELPMEHPVQAYMESIIDSGERAVGLTRQLTAIGAGRPARLHPVGLPQMLDRMDALLRRTLGAEIELVMVADEEAVTIQSDESFLEQILLHLAVNAREAMPKGGTLTMAIRRVEQGTILCPCEARVTPGSCMMLSVSDTGAGIPPEQQRLIFEPFFTTRSHHSGLGLSLVYSLVHQCGGHLCVENRLEGGVEFRLFFPTSSLAARKTEGLPPEPVPARGRETVLVVEDEDRVRLLAASGLASLGYKVLKAGHGVDALVQAMQLQTPLDLVFTDLSMPQMGGRLLVEKLRQIRHDFKVLYTTGSIQDRALDADPHDQTPVLLKPYTLAALAQKVRSVLERAS